VLVLVLVLVLALAWDGKELVLVLVLALAWDGKELVAIPPFGALLVLQRRALHRALHRMVAPWRPRKRWVVGCECVGLAAERVGLVWRGLGGDRVLCATKSRWDTVGGAAVVARLFGLCVTVGMCARACRPPTPAWPWWPLL
jgi:hypothetical protein